MKNIGDESLFVLPIYIGSPVIVYEISLTNAPHVLLPVPSSSKRDFPYTASIHIRLN